MSTYFFRTNIHGLGNIAAVKQQLDRMEKSGEIETWHLDINNPEAPLEIVTNQLTPELVKHRIRELGIDADFTTPPESRGERTQERAPGKP
ncbi:MAG: hypothetical protein EOO11_16620 [Chitinophagaceae bacterium]|nr:MAG: hypothetical protein EOO11_16620 [Chitinophagaceae bacterium]